SEEQRARERAPEGVGGHGRKVEQPARGLDRVRRLRCQNAKVAAARHPLNQSVVTLHGHGLNGPAASRHSERSRGTWVGGGTRLLATFSAPPTPQVPRLRSE